MASQVINPSVDKVTLIVGTAALIIENLPNTIEAAQRIAALFRKEGIETRIVEVNQQAIGANNEALKVIEDYTEKQE